MSIFPCEHARRASGKKNTAVSWHGTAPVIAALLEPYIPSCSHIFPGIAGKRGCDGGRRLFQMKKRCSLQRARTTPKSKPNWIINSSGAFVPSTTSLSLQISGYIISRFLNIPIQLSVPMWHLIFKADLFWGRKKKISRVPLIKMLPSGMNEMLGGIFSPFFQRNIFLTGSYQNRFYSFI